MGAKSCMGYKLESQLGRAGRDIAEKCPMRGRRAADLVGQYCAIFEEVAGECKNTLFMVHLASLARADQRDLMLDFEAGKARLATELKLRLSVWDTLPLKLFALGFHNQDRARKAMVECCLQFEQLSEQEQESSVHVLTTKLLSYKGVYRFFMQGGELSPALQSIAHQMLLTPTLEISVERLHAFLKQRTLASHHISGAYASLQLRRPEILKCHRTHFNELAECCSLVSSPAAIVEALELQHYPDFLEFHHDADEESNAVPSVRGCVPQSLVDAVIYRRHLDMQYMKLPEPQVALRRRARGNARMDADVAVDDVSTNFIAYEHFRATFNTSRFYAIKKKAHCDAEGSEGRALTHEEIVGNFFKPLASALLGDAEGRNDEALKRVQLEITGSEGGLPLASADGAGLQLTFAGHDDGPAPPPLRLQELPGQPRDILAQQDRDTRACRNSDYIFFRVVDARPGRRKRLRTDLMNAVGSEQLAVTLRDVLHADAVQKTVTVGLGSSSSSSCASRLFDGSVEAQKILTWDIAEDLVWLWRGHEDASWLNSGIIPVVLNKLFAAKAFQGVGNLPVSSDEQDMLSALRLLQDAGLTQRLELQGEQEVWQLLDVARSQLSCGVQLSNVQTALRVRPNQAPHAMTMWELLQSLLEDGFEQLSFTQGVDAFSVPRNGPKKIYSIGGRWCRSYLEAMVRRTELLEQDVRTIPRGCKASLCKALLSCLNANKKRGGQALRLQFAGEDGLMHDAAQAVAASSRARGHFGAGAAERVRQTQMGLNSRTCRLLSTKKVRPCRVARRRHEKTHYWPRPEGPCLLTFKPPHTWQATCPRSRSHRNPDRPSTKCTRAMSFSQTPWSW